MRLPRIIGLNGLKRSGKDTIGKALEREGSIHLSFAAPLYEAVYILNPWIVSISGFKTRRLGDLVDSWGWEYLKNSDAWKSEVRRLLEFMGTDVGRNLFGTDFWVDLAMKQVDDTNRYHFTDMRFENEIAAISAYKPDAYTLKVIRPGCVPNGHPSDRDLPNELFDGVVYNDGTIEDLQANALFLMRLGR